MTTPPSSPTPPPAAAPPPASPAPAAAPRRSGGGISPLLIAALIGAIVVIGVSFTPWLSSSVSDENVTGWELYSDAEDPPNGGFYTEDSFAENAPFFTGLSTVVAGALVALAALGLIAARGSDNDAVAGILAFLAIAAGVLLLVIAGTNLVSYLRKEDASPVDIEWGLAVTWGAALVSATIIPAALAGRGGDGVRSSSSGPVL